MAKAKQAAQEQEQEQEQATSVFVVTTWKRDDKKKRGVSKNRTQLRITGTIQEATKKLAEVIAKLSTPENIVRILVQNESDRPSGELNW